MTNSDDLHVLALVKERERYVFLYDPAYQSDLLLTFQRFAENPELSFTYYDAGSLLEAMTECPKTLQELAELKTGLPSKSTASKSIWKSLKRWIRWPE